MNRTEKFNNAWWLGRQAELRVIKMLEQRGHKVEDVSLNPSYYASDIDLYSTDKKGKRISIDVKNDTTSNYTNNVSVEMKNYNNVIRGCKGWWYYIEAEFICFVQDMLGKAHFITVDDLNNLLESHSYPLKPCCGGETKCLIVPISDLQKCQSYYTTEV